MTKHTPSTSDELKRLRDINADLLATLERIEKATRPGQEFDISGAIDAMCGIWNDARAAIEKATADAKATTP